MSSTLVGTLEHIAVRTVGCHCLVRTCLGCLAPNCLRLPFGQPSAGGSSGRLAAVVCHPVWTSFVRCFAVVVEVAN